MFKLIYANCTDQNKAEQLARTLVEEQLVASASIIPHTKSFYLWEGGLKEDQQVSVLMQCRTSYIKRVFERIRDMHSYDPPAVMATDITEGDPHFLDWMQRVLPADQPQEATDGI